MNRALGPLPSGSALAVGKQVADPLPAGAGETGVERCTYDVVSDQTKVAKYASGLGCFGLVEALSPVLWEQSALEDVDEPLGHVVGVGEECFPLVEDFVEGYSELRQGCATVDEASVRDPEFAVVCELNEFERSCSLDEVWRHRVHREPVEEFLCVQDDGVLVAE